MAPMPMTPPSADGVEIWYTTDGDQTSGEPLQLVMGLGAQHLLWDDGLVELLVERGFFVIRHDNRDVGLSSKAAVGDLPLLDRLLTAMGGEAVEAPYYLRDMAADAVAVLDDLGLDSAHVVGASMGGMIGQTMAIEQPERVRSLTSIMSTTGGMLVGQPSPGIVRQLLRRPPTGREQIAAHAERLFRVIGSPEPHFDGPAIRQQALRSFDRGFNPAGSARHMGAVVAARSRARELAQVKAPTTVIHGKLDRLVPISGGRATARAIPGAKLVEIDGMGHDMPRVMWPQILDAIEANARSDDDPSVE